MMESPSPDPTNRLAEINLRLEQNPGHVLALAERAGLYLESRQTEAALADARQALQIAQAEPRLLGEARARLLERLQGLIDQAQAMLDEGRNDSPAPAAPAESPMRIPPLDLPAEAPAPEPVGLPPSPTAQAPSHPAPVLRPLKELETELAKAHRDGDTPREAELLILIGSRYASSRNLLKSDDLLRKGLSLAQTAGIARLEAQAHVELGGNEAARHSLPAAAGHFQAVLAIGRQSGDLHYQHLGSGNLGAVYLQMSKADEGLELLKGACELAHQIGDSAEEADYHRNLGYYHLRQLDTQAGIEDLEQARKLLQSAGRPADVQIEETLRKTYQILNR